MNDDEDTGEEDIYDLGCKVIEMAERVQRADKIVPGAVARWVFEMDGARFEATVRVAPSAA